MMRRFICFGVLMILLIYMTGCLYPPELVPVEEKAAEPVIEPKVVELPPESITEPAVEDNETEEENKTVMASSDFTVNPTLDDSALNNSS